MPRGRPKGSKNRQPEAETEKTEQAKASDLKPMISANKLKRLLAAKRSLSKDIAEMNGTFGQMKREMIDNDHLDSPMFGVLAKFDKMENEKAAAHWDNLLYMMDVSGMMKRIESVQRLNLGERKAGGGEDDDTNVTKFTPADAA